VKERIQRAYYIKATAELGRHELCVGADQSVRLMDRARRPSSAPTLNLDSNEKV
jgi:hypothetical protein